jgi:UDP:flavonoid glycosyltransferase YjiC (YdhE family)
VLAAADRVEAEFVLVRGPQRRSLPGNVRSVGWIPLDRAMAGADALVHHGGAGGLLQALAAGIPQLVVPGPGDRRHNAELVDRRGAGLAVPARRITPAVLDRLVADAALRRTAGDLRDELAALPAPADLVPALTALAG